MLQDAFEFYYKATKLKELLRQGPIKWNVKRERMESIAEHTWGCLILAISLKSELKLDIDLNKVLAMLTIHELEEIGIGDITPLDSVQKETLNGVAREFVESLVSSLNMKEDLMALTDEFNEVKTPESKFTKAIDKLECVLEFKKYQDLGQAKLEFASEDLLKNKKIQEYIKNTDYDLADIFFLFHKEFYEEFGIDEEYWFNHLKPLDITKL